MNIKAYIKRYLQVKLADPFVDLTIQRINSYHRNRWDAIDNLADYLVGAEIFGDYLEFGVAQGMTFSYACRKMDFLNYMRFMAFDSFEGLPELKGIDVDKGYTSSFYAGQFAVTEEQFLENISKDYSKMEKVITVKGWFNESLTEATAKTNNLATIAAAWIDCDLYESTVPVLRFITPYLNTGSVLLFDDWRCFRNLPQYGEQRACAEWLTDNPNIRLHPLFSFGWHGQAFTFENISK